MSFILPGNVLIKLHPRNKKAPKVAFGLWDFHTIEKMGILQANGKNGHHPITQKFTLPTPENVGLAGA